MLYRPLSLRLITEDGDHPLLCGDTKGSAWWVRPVSPALPRGQGPVRSPRLTRSCLPSMPAVGKLLLKVGGCGGLAGRQASANTFKSEVTDKAIYGDSLASDHFPQGSRRPSAPLPASPSRRSLNHWLGVVAQGRPGVGLLGALQTAAGMKGGGWLGGRRVMEAAGRFSQIKALRLKETEHHFMPYFK